MQICGGGIKKSFTQKTKIKCKKKIIKTPQQLNSNPHWSLHFIDSSSHFTITITLRNSSTWSRARAWPNLLEVSQIELYSTRFPIQLISLRFINHHKRNAAFSRTIMADEKTVTTGGEKKSTASDTATTTTTPAGNGKKKRKGFFSRIWNFVFRSNKDDFEKRLQCISKEETSVMTRMNNRSRSWRRTSRHIILFSVLFEVYIIFLSFRFLLYVFVNC